MKHRVIPVVLTDGTTVVKGEKFVNWRTVGSAEAAARLYAARDVDELIFLDVNATRKLRNIEISLIQKFADILQIPFGVGGGINSLSLATRIIQAGAEKLILGDVAYSNPSLISQIATKFGSQAVTVSIDMCGHENQFIKVSSRSDPIKVNPLKYALELQELGAGEILLNSVNHDGLRMGMDLENIRAFSDALKIPVIASSGAGSISDFALALNAGASGVAAGAIFQFSEVTPGDVRRELNKQGFKVRSL